MSQIDSSSNNSQTESEPEYSPPSGTRLTLDDYGASYMMRKQRASVSAEAYGEWNKREDFVAPVYQKTTEQKQRILQTIDKAFMFNCLETDELETVVKAFEETKIEKGTTIIQQGDDGNCLYLVEDGELEVTKIFPGSKVSKFLTMIKAGDIVGELALLYNTPRAASVTAVTDCILWSLGRQSFNSIVRDAAARKRELYETFLAEVELLKDIDPYERAKLSDALRVSFHKEGDLVVKQGDTGDCFYIIESGEAEAVKDGVVVMQYKRGDYFGELALLKSQPRAASIKAKCALKCLYLDRLSFKRLVGPIEQILIRNTSRYHQILKPKTDESKDTDKK